MNEVYKILIPIAEAHRDFKKLANIHKYERKVNNSMQICLHIFLLFLANSTMLLLELNSNMGKECLALTSALGFTEASLEISTEKNLFTKNRH